MNGAYRHIVFKIENNNKNLKGIMIDFPSTFWNQNIFRLGLLQLLLALSDSSKPLTVDCHFRIA